VSSIFGMTVVLGPVIGPVFGGQLAEAYGWRWAFYMIVPAGVLASFALWATLPRDKPGQPTPLDWTGFLALTVAIGCVQLVLSRGQRLDWYESTEIIIESVIAALAFYVFIAHSLTAKQPFLNLRLLLDRNYALGLLLVFIYGMVNFTPIVLLPSLLQQYAGYPDSVIGEIVGFRGIGGTIGFALTFLIGRWDPRIGMAIGFAAMVAAGLWLMSFDLNVSEEALLWNAVLQGISVGIIWVPLTVLTFKTLDREHLPEAMAMFHLLRNIGSSLFISLSVAEIIRSGAANYSRMTEMISPFNRTLQLPGSMGGFGVETVPELAKMSSEITRQAAMIGYVNGFGLFTAASAVAILLVLFAGGRRRGA